MNALARQVQHARQNGLPLQASYHRECDDSGQACIQDHGGTLMETSLPTRMFTVQAWAQKNPKQ